MGVLFFDALGIYFARYKLAQHRRPVILTMLGIAWNRGQRDPVAKRRIQKYLDQSDPDAWTRAKVEFLIGELSEDAFYAMVNGPGRQCEAGYFAAVDAHREGYDKAAIRRLLLSLETGVTNYIEFDQAIALLEELDS